MRATKRSSSILQLRDTGRQLALRPTWDRLALSRRTVPWLPIALCVLAAVTIVWSRAIGLGNSLAADETESAIWWIAHGPATIFSNAHYVPGDHLLYNLLTWATLQVTGLEHVDFAYRFWSALPGLAAVAALGWWAWQRLDHWVAAVFLVLAGGSQLYLYFGANRGYGFGFLGAALTVIGADQLLRWRPVESGAGARAPRIRTATALFAGGAVVGMWSLPNFVTMFVLLSAVLMTVTELRRRIVVLFVAVGAATLVFYAPVLPAVISNASQHFGQQLPLFGFLTHPLTDLVTPNVTVLLPSFSQTGAEILAASLLAIGGVVLALRSDGYLALVLLVPAFGTYLILEIVRTYVADRFESFLLLPLLVVGAVALVALGRLVARGGRLAGGGRPAGAIVAVIAAVLALVALNKNIKQAQMIEGIPYENYRQMAQVAIGSGVKPIVMVGTQPQYAEIKYYFSGVGVVSQTLAALEARFCARGEQFVFVDLERHPALQPHTSCLVSRGAVQIPIEQRRFPITVWIVPRAAH